MEILKTTDLAKLRSKQEEQQTLGHQVDDLKQSIAELSMLIATPS